MTYQEYQDLVKDKYFEFKTGDATKRIYPAAAFFTMSVDGYDFRHEQILIKQDWPFETVTINK